MFSGQLNVDEKVVLYRTNYQIWLSVEKVNKKMLLEFIIARTTATLC